MPPDWSETGTDSSGQQVLALNLLGPSRTPVPYGLGNNQAEPPASGAVSALNSSRRSVCVCGEYGAQITVSVKM